MNGFKMRLLWKLEEIDRDDDDYQHFSSLSRRPFTNILSYDDQSSLCLDMINISPFTDMETEP